MRNIREEQHSQYLGSKRNKDTNTEDPPDTPSYVNPGTKKDNLSSDDKPNKWPEGTICIAGDCILNEIDGSLQSQKRLVKIRRFPEATITDIVSI